MSRKRGFMLVLCTALISGFSIFINSFAIAKFDPFVLTGLRNMTVALLTLAFIHFTSKLKRISKADWLKLAGWGALDGGVAFMLYFYGMKASNLILASILHKSIFIFASAIAFLVLKEKLSWKWAGGAALLLGGAIFISGIPSLEIKGGEVAILGAVLLWAAGNVIAKKLLGRISVGNVIFGRMFFGSITILAFLAATGSTQLSLTTEHYIWLLATSLLLAGYQLTYFNGLAFLKVSEATSVLAFGSVVTSLLSLFVMKQPTPLELLGIIGIASGVALVYLSGEVDVHHKTIPRC
ncbi:MAG: DMT family transporter [Candidatus Micrarchaeia archaeon]